MKIFSHICFYFCIAGICWGGKIEEMEAVRKESWISLLESFDGLNYPSLEILRTYPVSYHDGRICFKWIFEDVLREKSSLLSVFIYIEDSLENPYDKYSQSKYVWWVFESTKNCVKNVVQNLNETWWDLLEQRIKKDFKITSELQDIVQRCLNLATLDPDFSPEDLDDFENYEE